MPPSSSSALGGRAKGQRQTRPAVTDAGSMHSVLSSHRSESRRAEAGSAENGSKGDEHDLSSSSCLSRWHRKVNRLADDFFYRLGRRTALNPKKVIAAALLCVIICCTGFINFRTESESSNLWVPRESISRDQEELILSFFGEDNEWALLLYENPEENGNVLTKQYMDVVWEVDAKVMELQTGAGETYADICVTNLDGDECAQPFRGITRFWGNSFETYEATVSDDADVLAAVNVDNFPDGAPVGLAAILGNSITYDDEGKVVAAGVMMQSYGLSTNDEAELEAAAEWELELQNFFGDEAGAIREEDGVNVVYFTSRSLDDALGESVSGEIFLFGTTYLVMVVTVMVCVGRCLMGAVERRSWLGLGGVGIVIAAGLAAYGLCSGFGVPFTSLSQILPFILVGIGVDDMFVIIAAIDHTDIALPVEERLALALKRCGVSITYSSLTNFTAFLLGSITKLPAVEYFCVYAATSILFVFILQVTVFSAFLAMDLNRQNAGKMDWCCCCKSKAWSEEQVKRGVDLPAAGSSSKNLSSDAANHVGEEARADSIASSYRRQSTAEEVQVYANPIASLSLRALSAAVERSGSVAFHGHNSDGGGKGEVLHLTGVGKWMRDKYTPFILSKKGVVLVLMATGGLFIAGIYGVTKVTQGFDALDLAPDEHFARDFMETAREYDLEPDSFFVGAEIFVPAVDYTNSTVQALIQATDTYLTSYQTYYNGPVDSWLTSFAAWAATNPAYRDSTDQQYGYRVYKDPPTFYSALDDFLAEDGKRFQSDIAFDENGAIAMSFSNMFIVDLRDTETRINALKEGRDVMATTPLEPAPFVSSGVFLYIEQFLVIYNELITNFLLALVAVAVLSLIVLGSLPIVVLVCFTVFIIDVELLGFVYHWGLQLNAINVIELIMAVGLVVDYMVHILHYYLHQDRTISKNLRIGLALGEIGPSVLVGAMTTFLGIMVMAFASNVIFRVFFKMFLIIITFGFFHGLVFIPVALSLLPESSPCCSCGSSAVTSPSPICLSSDARKIAHDDGEDDPNSLTWMPYAGQPERVHGGGGGPSTANRSKIYCRRCSSVIDEEEEEEEGKDGDATGPLSSGDAVAGGGDAGGEGADGTRSVEEEEELGVHQQAGEGAAETVNNNDAASSSASGRGGVTAVPVQRGDGLGGAPENSMKVDVLDVEQGSGLGTPGGTIPEAKATSERGQDGRSFWKPHVKTGKLGTPGGLWNPQTVGTPPNKWPAVETHGGLGTPGRKMTTSKAGGGSPASWEADAGSARASSATSGIPASMEKVFKWGIDREGLAEYDGLEGSKSPVVTDAMSPTGTKGTAT